MLRLDNQARGEMWRHLNAVIEKYLNEVHTASVAPALDANKIRALLSKYDFDDPMSPNDAINFVAEGMWKYQVHTAHPRYFGLFNPPSTTMGIAADALAAAFNPQLAAWGHSPFATEVEQHLIRHFGRRFGYDPAMTDGTFTSGGSEANHTAVLTALTQAAPDFGEYGVRALPGQPVIYISSEGHHSLIKAARACGLGSAAVREISVDERLRMSVEELIERIEQDKAEGFQPLMIVATVGTTSAGIIDPVSRLAEVAAREGIWFHVDAAWGGAAALVPGLKDLLFQGIERADSITFDAHKWLSVPMGAGIYLTRHPDILQQTFRVATGYMPRDAAGLDVVEPYMHSLQWSRRFIGLKVFLSMLVAGWEGYIEHIRHQIAMGDHLRRALDAARWEVVNRTPLPIVCFVDREHPEGRTAEYLNAIVRMVVESGEAWISSARIGRGQTVIRAGITNYRTGPENVEALVTLLNQARSGGEYRNARCDSKAI
jgi:glutamate/tyrosine decarboxylase-like PLP-dependent enzyme